MADETTAIEADEPASEAGRLRVKGPLVAFLVTVASVFVTSADSTVSPPSLGDWREGVAFTVALLAILVTHEFGHYIAARIHGVPASLPYFIPLPFVSPFGTMGAVIGMQARIRSRRALLDIGAAGPIAGMVMALPILAYGIHLSPVHAAPPMALDGTAHELLEGHSILYEIMLRLFGAPIGDGQDIFLHPFAFAGWAGLFVTMLNLIPVGQLDGGHIAYALFGARQDRLARWLRRSMPGMFVIAAAKNTWAIRHAPLTFEAVKNAVSGGTLWLVWFGLLTWMLRRARGENHPPFDPGEELGPGRKAIAIGCLVMFVLLFMPAPLTPR